MAVFWKLQEIAEFIHLARNATPQYYQLSAGQ